MSQSLSVLNNLAASQQFKELKNLAQSLWDDSADNKVLPLLALAHAQLGEMQLAQWVFQQAAKYEYNSDGMADLAAVLILLHRIDQAESLLQPVLARHPDHALALARFGHCKMLKGELQLAQHLFELAANLAPNLVLIQANLASVLIRQERYQQAQSVIDMAWTSLNNQSQNLPPASWQQFDQSIALAQCQLWVESARFACADSWLKQVYDQQQDDPKHFISQLSQYGRLLAEANHHDQAADVLREYLKHFPDDTSLCLQLAEIQLVQGRFMPAINLMRRALKQDQDNIAIWAQLSGACLHRFDQQARHAAQKAVSLADGLEVNEQQSQAKIDLFKAQAKNALALVESHAQNYELAEQLFREVLAEHEYFLPALQGFGQQQMQRGNIDEAVELFERIKAINPIKGYSSLINARHFPEDERVLEKMAQAANMPSMEGPVRSGILFQLAAAWEKRKEYDKAFAFAQQANEATRKFLPYSAKAHRQRCARIRYAFGSSLFEHRTDCGHTSTLPVFVVGMPRSGTTLVEQILSGHSEIYGAGELGVIPQRIQGLNRWERHVGSGRSYPDCVDDLSPYVTEGIAQGIIDELQKLAEEDKPDAKYVVDKLPHNFENIGLIKFLFPQAKIISVRRDPRDIAMSNYFTDYQAKYGGMGFAYDLEDIGQQLADHNLLMHHWNQVFPGEIFEIQYEDVVEDLAASAKKMLAYIGVEWQPQVVNFNELERAVKTASVWQVRQPIYTSSKAKWRRYQDHLAPLIKGTNAAIEFEPIDDMLSLPEPGFVQTGVDHYHNGQLDDAELCFQKMLHHNPNHAASRYMLGLVYLSKHHYEDGIAQVEQALEICPWHKDWRESLAQAHRETGDEDKAQAVEQGAKPAATAGADGQACAQHQLHDAVTVTSVSSMTLFNSD